MSFLGVLQAAGPIIGAVSSFLGQEDSNDTNRAIADQNNQTSIELANTAYQRRVKDLQAAGLNPMLAYTQGGAQVPSLQQARVENSAAAAVEGGLKGMSQALLRSQIDTQESQTQLNSALASKAQQEARSAAADAVMKEIDADVKAKVSTSPNSPGYVALEESRLSASVAQNLYNRLKANNDWNTVGYLNELASEHGYRNFETAIGSQEFRQLLAANLIRERQGSLLGFKLPEGKAMADFWSSPYGKDVAPYLNSAGKAVDIFTDLAPQTRRFKFGK